MFLGAIGLGPGTGGYGLSYSPSLRSRLRFVNVDVDDVWKLFKWVLSKLFATAVMELWLSRKSPVSAQTEKNKPAQARENYKKIYVLTGVCSKAQKYILLGP